MQLHDLLTGLWCAVSVAKIIGLFVTRDHKFTTIYYTLSDTMFEDLSDYERTHAVL
jgi:hypothetical protein